MKTIATAIGLLVLGLAAPSAWAQADKPNILVIWGDDIGITNISAYSQGLMGYQTPNIDRIAKEGALFTCTTTAGSPRGVANVSGGGRRYSTDLRGFQSPSTNGG